MGKLIGAKVNGFNRDLEIPCFSSCPFSSTDLLCCLTLVFDARSKRCSDPIFQLDYSVQALWCICVEYCWRKSGVRPFSFVLLPFALSYIVLYIRQWLKWIQKGLLSPSLFILFCLPHVSIPSPLYLFPTLSHSLSVSREIALVHAERCVAFPYSCVS